MLRPVILAGQNSDIISNLSMGRNRYTDSYFEMRTGNGISCNISGEGGIINFTASYR